ncbi:hypothetical protein GCM10022226_19200 [Sphaerisporangium flaviroseum]|uniref:Uncharacterized protein n=1 Tax=Sphaerisporangium flaviroseum TaxID=509199 RepID=A0ABP7HVY1_9ACTN
MLMARAMLHVPPRVPRWTARRGAAVLADAACGEVSVTKDMVAIEAMDVAMRRRRDWRMRKFPSEGRERMS